MNLTQFLQDHSCSSFYCGLSRQIDPEYTGFVLCKRNMVSWLFQIVIIGQLVLILLVGLHYSYSCLHCTTKCRGRSRKFRRGWGREGGGVRGTCQLYRYYLFYGVFFKYSAKFHRKRGGYGSCSQSLPPPLKCSLGVDVGRVTSIFLQVVGPLLKF